MSRGLKSQLKEGKVHLGFRVEKEISSLKKISEKSESPGVGRSVAKDVVVHHSSRFCKSCEWSARLLSWRMLSCSGRSSHWKIGSP